MAKTNKADAAYTWAFSLYCGGLAGKALLDEIHRYHPDVTETRLKKWIADHDWVARRAAIDARSQVLTDQVQDAELAAMHHCVETMTTLRQGINESRTNHHLYYAVQGLAETLLKASRQRDERIAPRRIATEVIASVVEDLIAGLREIPALRPLLPTIAQDIQRLTGAVLEKHAR